MKRFLTFIVVLVVVATIVSACDFKDDDAEKSVEEPTQTFTVGLINPHHVMDIFFEKYIQEMANRGYVEGENITYIMKGPPENLAEILLYPTELVQANVDLMIVVATEGGILAQAVTDEVPIIFVAGDQPIEVGLVASFEKPGGNVTGIVASGPEARRLQLLLEIDPRIKRVYAPYNPSDVQSRRSYEELSAAADILNVEVVTRQIHNDAELSAALHDIPEDIDGIFIVQDVLIATEIQTWSDEAIARKLPLSAPGAGEAETSYALPITPLMGYGIYLPDLAQKTARLSEQILQGASPGDIPVETAEFYLLVNLQTAKEIGVDIPDSILEQADIIIRD